jgi:hypothetical protein
MLTWPEGVEDLLGLLPHPDDELERQDAYALVVKSLAQLTMSSFGSASYPDFVPAVGSVFNGACPDPDFVYLTTQLDGRGTYRLAGYRGTTRFVTAVLSGPAVRPAELDLDELTVADDGWFEVLLSAERPADHAGDWRPLDPGVTALSLRQASYDWRNEVDGRFTIERLDVPASPPAPDASTRAKQLQQSLTAAVPYARMWLEHVAGLRRRGMVNRLELDDWADRGGIPGQWYFQGIFELEPDEAILLETDVPDCRYWNVQLSDPLWNAIDWIHHQSGLNGFQARLDRDSRFRAVVAVGDPGVPNWLDPGGYRRGTILGRWNKPSVPVLPTLTVMPFAQVRSHLPADTPVVTPVERQRSLRKRREGAQLRRRW